jgi:hypothetical protein
LGGFKIKPVIGLSGPGAQIPIPATLVAPSGRTRAIAENTAFNPSCAEEFAIIGSRTWDDISPSASTSPAATFVPPMSTPTNQLFFNSPFSGSKQFYASYQMLVNLS